MAFSLCEIRNAAPRKILKEFAESVYKRKKITPIFYGTLLSYQDGEPENDEKK